MSWFGAFTLGSLCVDCAMNSGAWVGLVGLGVGMGWELGFVDCELGIES